MQLSLFRFEIFVLLFLFFLLPILATELLLFGGYSYKSLLLSLFVLLLFTFLNPCLSCLLFFAREFSFVISSLEIF